MVKAAPKLSLKSDGRLGGQALFDNLLQIRECAAADEQNVRSVHRHHGNHAVLTVRAYRHLYLRALQHLQQLLLNGLTADIASGHLLFLCDLVNLVDVNNAVLRLLHIVIRCREKFSYNTLNIIADITRLSQRGGICNRQRYIQKLRQRLYQISLTASGRSDQKYI